MRIFVTGARGFTGRHFVLIAQRDGHIVFESTANLLDRSAIEKELSSFLPDAIVHLAAISFVNHGDPNQIYSINVIGTENLLNAATCCAPNIGKVLIASSANVYGNAQSVPIGETVHVNPVNHYAISKVGSEYIAKTFQEMLPIIITRPFNYTGGGQDVKFLVPKIVSHFAQKKSSIELGNLTVRREFNDVRMVCESYLRLLQLDIVPQSAVNICTGIHYSIQDIIDTLNIITGHALAVHVNPDFVRKNEIAELYGDPTLLIDLIGNLPKYTLHDTLQTMIADFQR